MAVTRTGAGSLALLAVAALLTTAQASAQPYAKTGGKEPERWLVLPSTAGQSGDPGHAARKAAALLSAELETRGKRVLKTDESKRLFEQRGSSPPMAINASDVDGLARDAQQALYHVASGLYSRAQQDVERAMERAQRALESLNRETRAARHLLDACMFLVRGHLERGDRERARRQALECRRLVPDIDPDPTVHPPNVIGVLAEAEAELLSLEPSSLRVESSPPGCAVIINGRNLGTTPKELARLSAGEYRVQVECNDGEPGRVHRAALNGNRAVVRVDTRFDRVVQTAFDFSLRYESPDEDHAHRVRDAVEAARAVGATELVVTWLPAAGDPLGRAVSAGRYRVVDGEKVAETRIALGASDAPKTAAAREAVRSLLEAQAPEEILASVAADPEDGLGARPSTLETALTLADEPPPIDAPEPDQDHSELRTAGLVASGVGLAANLAGWGLYGRHVWLQSEYSDALNARVPERFEEFRRIDNFELVPSLSLGGGALVLAASLPLWLPEERGVPVYAWAAGGAGLLAAAVGAKLALDAGNCPTDEFGRCTQPELATRLGTLLLMQSLPLLSLPITYGVRALAGDHVEAEFSLRGGRGAVLTLSGTL